MLNAYAVEVPPESRLASELEPDERLLWSGRPRQGLVLHPLDIFLIPFSLLWGGFAIFWETMAVWEMMGFHQASRSQAPHRIPIFFVMWGIPFVLMGLYFIFGRFIADARLRAKTMYGITDRRALILTGVIRMRAFDLHSLSDLSLSERRDGTGTITFGSAASWTPFPAPSLPGMGGYARPCFYSIHQPRRVYEMIREAQRKLG